MAFKMKYGNGDGFPFLGMGREQWAPGTTRKQARVERRLRKLKTKGKTDSRKYQRNLDRIQKMREKGTYVAQGIVGDGQGNLVSRGTLGKGGDTEYGKLYYQGPTSIMGSEGPTTEQNQQLASLRHKG
tara:strand:- start:249 stop:632 length:384 start_codon:yes stop_codon:yes gene_type:complete